VRRQVAVIAATGDTVSPLAAKGSTTAIPIVFVIGSDPVAAGLVASLNRPGGNLTGVTSLSVEIEPKRLQLLHELVPTATVMAALVNPSNPNAEPQAKALEAAAGAIDLQLLGRIGSEAVDGRYSILGRTSRRLSESRSRC
jgi:putative ABC transport system substrate-binding protein